MRGMGPGLTSRKGKGPSSRRLRVHSQNPPDTCPLPTGSAADGYCRRSQLIRSHVHLPTSASVWARQSRRSPVQPYRRRNASNPTQRLSRHSEQAPLFIDPQPHIPTGITVEPCAGCDSAITRASHRVINHSSQEDAAVISTISKLSLQTAVIGESMTLGQAAPGLVGRNMNGVDLQPGRLISMAIPLCAGNE